jgi:hypothetical protein
MEIFTAEGFAALLQVMMIDLVLAGDNAIVIGLAAAGLPKDQRAKAILVGIIAATVLRIFFATITVQLLAITGLLLAGGILLLWVCWKMWRELRAGHADAEMEAQEALANADLNADGTIAGGAPRKSFRQADRAHGNRRVVHCPVAEQAPLDRLHRPCDHPLRGARHDLARLARGFARADADDGRVI